jgi:hypothetical protein
LDNIRKALSLLIEIPPSISIPGYAQKPKGNAREGPEDICRY